MKILRSLFFICCIVLAATVCRAEEEIEPTKADVYLAEGVTIVLPADWKPFSFVDEAGQRTGYLVELWDAWAKASGIAMRVEFMDPAAGVEKLKAREVDVLGGLRYSDEYVEFLDYADSVQSSTSVLAIREDGPVDCSNVLAKGVVGMVDDVHVRQMAAAKYPYLNSISYADEKQAIAAFMDGEVSGVVVGYPHLVVNDAETSVLDGLNICRTLFYHEVYAGVQKGQEELLGLVNDGLNSIPEDEMKSIEGRWFPTAEQPKPKWLAASLPAVVALCLLVGIVVLWSRKR